MSHWTKNGGSAFPNPSLADESYRAQPGDMGMTLRDWFAGQALVGVLSSPRFQQPLDAADLYRIADVMIAARGADQ